MTYFGLTKEEEALEELRNMINTEIRENVDPETKEVHIPKPDVKLPEKYYRAYAVSIILGDHFDEYSNARCHARSDDLFNGKFEPELGVLIAKTIKNIHDKTSCEKCKNGRKFMIPTDSTIIKNYGLAKKGKLYVERHTW